MSEEELKVWKEKLQIYVQHRKDEEDLAKKDIEDKYNSLILTKLANTTYTDKLYQIAMEQPEVWKELKRKEYEEKINMEKNAAVRRINTKYKMLTQGLEKEEYFTSIIDKGHSKVLHDIQADDQVVTFILLQYLKHRSLLNLPRL